MNGKQPAERTSRRGSSLAGMGFDFPKYTGPENPEIHENPAGGGIHPTSQLHRVLGGWSDSSLKIRWRENDSPAG
jgi:hypothetical protein